MFARPAALAVACALACATPQKRPADIVPGELLIRSDAPDRLTTDELSAVSGRDDFVVTLKECLPPTCRVVVERKGAKADPEWTYALIDALAKSRPPHIQSVEPNVLHQPR